MIWNFVANFLVCSVFITVQFQYEYDVEHWSVTFLIKHCDQSSLLRRNQKFYKLSLFHNYNTANIYIQFLTIKNSLIIWQNCPIEQI